MVPIDWAATFIFVFFIRRPFVGRCRDRPSAIRDVRSKRPCSLNPQTIRVPINPIPATMRSINLGLAIFIDEPEDRTEYDVADTSNAAGNRSFRVLRLVTMHVDATRYNYTIVVRMGQGKRVKILY